MHLMYSTAIGTEVIDDQEHQVHGIVSDILIHPDTGKIMGVFVATGWGSEPLLLQTIDIRSWGKRVHIGSVDVLSPLEDVIRLQDILDDPRTVIGQRIRTSQGRSVGKCVDVQFDTKHFRMEWIFPRRWFRMRPALPVSDIDEVTPEAILVRDIYAKEEQIAPVRATSPATPDVDAVPSPTAGRTSR